MKFNIFSLGDQITDPVTGQRRDARQRHRMIVEMAVRAEAAGFNGVNVGEHHGLEYIVSAPPVLLAAIAEHTTALRLGTAVTLLANLDALRIAEDYATVDVLSGGRVDIVSGRGNFFESTYTLFGQAIDESRDRFTENAELLDALWSGESVSWQGNFRAPVTALAVQPRPLQSATEALWLGGGSSNDSVELAARLGWKLMLPAILGNPENFIPVVDHYLQKWSDHGHQHDPEIGSGWHVFVAPTSAAARATWEPRYRAYHDWMQELLPKVNRSMPAHVRPFDFDLLTTKGPAIVGSPEQVVDRIGTLSEKLKVTTHLLYTDMGGMPDHEVFDTIDLLGSAVLPALRPAVS